MPPTFSSLCYETSGGGTPAPMIPEFETLFSTHRRELISHLTRIVRCGEVAQELVQESYIVLVKEARREPVLHPRGFLYRVATHLAFDYLRRRKLEPGYLEEMPQVDEPSSHSAEKVASDREKVEVFRKALAELPPRCREAFVLHKLQGHGYRQVAKLLGISESAVEKHIMKALVHCRGYLKAHGYALGEPD